ncbi:hypothetical protein KW794_02075 [Candidatus Saccharibacteria bacterium]|nr:hypothetical protein [Candidatus Saccharibacteria bacterium]
MGDVIPGNFGREEPVEQPEGHMWSDDGNVSRLEAKPDHPEIKDARIEAAAKAVIEFERSDTAFKADSNDETLKKRGEASVRKFTLINNMQPQDQAEVYRRVSDMRGEVGHG